MIHLITRLPHPYHETLSRALHDSYDGDFTAWFAERNNCEFPFRRESELPFRHRYLTEVGYRTLWRELKVDSQPLVILGGWSSPMTNRTLTITKLLGVPVLIWADHPHPRKRSWAFSRLRRNYLRFLTPTLVLGFLACGKPTVDYLKGLGITAEAITEFPYWVKVPRHWSPPKRCLNGNSSQETPLRLVAVGRLVKVKQFSVAIEAVARADEKAGHRVAELMIIGDGPERANLEGLAKSFGLEQSVTFGGWFEADQVYEALERTDAFVMPSTFDAFGVAVLEAMAAGRPVLASDGVIAARDRDEGSGAILFHPVGDAETLADQIILLASDCKLLSQASNAARATAEKWPPERAAAILQSLLD